MIQMFQNDLKLKHLHLRNNLQRSQDVRLVCHQEVFKIEMFIVFFVS